MISPSQGIHLVFDRSFFRAIRAIMVPHTSDGRVMFAIPWHGHTLVGTTDTPIPDRTLEPCALRQTRSNSFSRPRPSTCTRPPSRDDVLSVFAGIRPLVKPQGESAAKTASLSRDHTIHIDPSGLLTIAGGKWTTYRHMAEDCVNHAITLGKLRDADCVTRSLKLHGYREQEDEHGSLWVYGSTRKRSAPSPLETRPCSLPFIPRFLIPPPKSSGR